MNKEEIENEIRRFKSNVKEISGWETGQHILNFINVDEALNYGRLLGQRDAINELSKQHQKKVDELEKKEESYKRFVAEILDWSKYNIKKVGKPYKKCYAVMKEQIESNIINVLQEEPVSFLKDKTFKEAKE